MKKILATFLFAGISSWTTPTAQAQTPQAFSLKQSIDYALQNQLSLKNAQLATKSAKAQVGAIRAIGLPQINGGAQLIDNVKLQKSLVDFSGFAGPSLDPFVITQQDLTNLEGGNNIVLTPNYTPAPKPEKPQYTPLAFGLQYGGSAAITASQLLFDGSYLLGLKAAKVYTDLSAKQLMQTEQQVIENVSKAYYGVLVVSERIAVLDQNLKRLEAVLRETREINRQGFAEKIDVDRLQVSYNNLKVEKDKAERLRIVTTDLLKFQMGMEIQEPITVTDRLADIVVDAELAATNNFNYSQRIEYSILETQRSLANLDVKNKQAGYYPKLLLNAQYGINGSSREFNDLMQLRTKTKGDLYQNWFDFASVGLSLQVPIFDGLRKKYEVQQAKIAVETANNGFKVLKQSIDLQLSGAV